MDKTILDLHIKKFALFLKSDKKVATEHYKERLDSVKYYRAWNKEKLLAMSEDDLYEYISQLWAMLIWGNKHYVVDKAIDDNGFDNLKKNLAELLYGTKPIENRWDNFRKNIKGFGPAMISEILCKTNPNEYMIWNRRAFVGLKQLQVKDLPRYDYQLTGEVYKNLCATCKEISKALRKEGLNDTTLLAVDYFLWEELQVEDNLNQIHSKGKKEIPVLKNKTENEFIHNDIRDKIAEIGTWLGMRSGVEKSIAKGSRVDTIWEATIGNMGRVIYVFEVQTGGSIDSLILNLRRAINNHAVQTVVAVSDSRQIEKIKKEVEGITELERKIKYWDYENVLKVHESLSFTNESINNLGLVPQGF